MSFICCIYNCCLSFKADINVYTGSWSEHNVIRDRLKKLWDEYQNAQPKAQVNWDRNARAPVKPVPIEPVKPKPKKQPPKPKESKQKESEFEEIKFVTPPITPPPEKVTLAPKAGKDNEFWDFYDKGGSGKK